MKKEHSGMYDIVVDYGRKGRSLMDSISASVVATLNIGSEIEVCGQVRHVKRIDHNKKEVVVT